MDLLDRFEVEELILETKELMDEPDLKEMAVKTAGWDKSSVKKFGDSIGKNPGEKGFFDACVSKMGSKMDDPNGFCASLKDTYYGDTKWRGKEK